MRIEPRVIPFQVGKPITDPADFVGRREVLQYISNGMLNLQNISLHGERRTGKTSLLCYLAHPVSSSVIGLPETHVPVYFDFQAFAEASAANVWQAMANAVAERIRQRFPDKQVGSEFLAIMAKLLGSSGAPEWFGTGFGQALSYLGNSGFKIHLLLDEFDQTARNPDLGDPFYDTLRSLPTRTGGNVSYVIATRTGLAALQPRYNKVSSPFFNIFTRVILGPFPEDEALLLIFDYFTRAGLDVSLAEKLCGESSFLHDVTGYHPFFLQMLCYHLCASLDKPDWPLGQLRQETLQAFERDSKEHFEFYWRYSSEEEQELIKKLAFGQSITWDRFGHVVKSLEDRCLIIRVGSGMQLFSSVFARWVREKTEAECRKAIEDQQWTMGAMLLEKLFHLEPINEERQQQREHVLKALHKEGKQYEATGDLNSLMRVVDRMLGLDPGNQEVLKWKESALQQMRLRNLYDDAWSRKEQGNWAGAKRLLDEIVSIDAQFRDIQELRSRVTVNQRVSFARRWVFTLLIVLGVVLVTLLMPRLVARQQLGPGSLAVTPEFLGAVVGVFWLIVSLVGLLIPAERMYELLRKDKRLRAFATVTVAVLLVTACLLVRSAMTLVSGEVPLGTPTLGPAMLCNGDFEDDFECWQHGGELRQDVECEGGQCYAVLGSPDYKCEGGVPVGEAWIKQSFQVPETVSPTLSLRYRVFSYDLSSYDFFQVSINDNLVSQFGNTEWTESSCNRQVWDSGWQSVEFDLSSCKGESVELFLHNVNGVDNGWNTWTCIDDVEIR